MLHPTLERQLTRHGILDLSAPPTVEQWYRFLERASQTYAEADQQRAALEYQVRQTTAELRALHDDCLKAIDSLILRVEASAEQDELLTLLNSYRPTCKQIEPVSG